MAALRGLGLNGTISDAKTALSLLGWSGQLPWALPEVLSLHPYIDLGGLMLVPPAHCILRGIVRPLFIFALTTTTSDLAELRVGDASVVYGSAQRKFVQVGLQRVRGTGCSCDSSAACTGCFGRRPRAAAR